ncbi:hypothetical protein JCM19992_16280 [Thermostilla marina]
MSGGESKRHGACPNCGGRLLIPQGAENVGVRCPLCGHVFHPKEAENSPFTAAPAFAGTGKFCPGCGGAVHPAAEICLRCGVRLPALHGFGFGANVENRGWAKIPLLISAIANIVVGLIWLATCFGVVLTVPMVVLCIFEFKAWAEADDMPLDQLIDHAGNLAIAEIVVGLFNTATLVCGIILAIQSSKKRRRYFG